MLTGHLDKAKFVLATFLFVGLCVTSFARQNASGSQSTTPTPAPVAAQQPASDSTSDRKPLNPQSSPADARQAQLRADTERLYQLTEELKAEVAKSNKDTLSISVIKKADEVEKLAKSLKERMKTEQ
jgi:hypothetical protein